MFLSVFVFCQVGYSSDTLTSDDLPGVGESLVISSDSILTIGADETVVVDDAVLQINGTENTVTDFLIVNNGEFTIKSTSIGCSHANFTIQNMGTMNFQVTHSNVIGNSTLSIDNEGYCSMSDISIQVYGGFAYFKNSGSLVITNGYFKDQLDGTFITNYGTAVLNTTMFVANGASGKIELFNSGDMKLHQGFFDVNYGGTINLNSLTGTLSVSSSSMDVSGWSHGQQSTVNILAAIATWDTCSFVNNDGKINYLNTGEVDLTDCDIFMSSVNSSTILSSTGPMFFDNFQLSGSGSTSITNWDSMTMANSNLDSSHSLTFMNNGELTAENWLVKTTSSTARIVLYVGNNGSITFNQPFIENVSSNDLTAIGPDGQEFVEYSGGTIVVTNNGSLAPQGSSHDIVEYVLYGLVIAVAVIVSIYIIRKNRKKSSNKDS
jgi:hypothetical protein